MQHFHRYSKKEIISKLKKVGFSIGKIFYWNFVGLIFYVIFEKLLFKRVYEGVRCSEKAPSRFVNYLLRLWLRVENKLHFPLGLTLIVVAKNKILP